MRASCSARARREWAASGQRGCGRVLRLPLIGRDGQRGQWRARDRQGFAVHVCGAERNLHAGIIHGGDTAGREVRGKSVGVESILLLVQWRGSLHRGH